MATRLRVDTITGTLRKRLDRLGRTLQANEFRPELQRYTTRVLNDCIAQTPARSEAKIVTAQRKQYRNRINAIPTVHELTDPALRVNEMGEEWIYSSGKWYNAIWRLPDEVWADYSMLSDERNRRMATLESEFIEKRKQARWLYKRSWYQVAVSLGLSITAAAQIISSHTRRKPAVAPPKAYGQWRGGKGVLSVVIRNPFMDEKSRYAPGNGDQILARATAKERPRFLKECNDKVKREISAARQVR